MNLTTRRLSETELKEWAQKSDHKMWSFRVSDKFGDSGLTGIASLAIDDKKGKIVPIVHETHTIGIFIADPDRRFMPVFFRHISFFLCALGILGGIGNRRSARCEGDKHL